MICQIVMSAAISQGSTISQGYSQRTVPENRDCEFPLHKLQFSHQTVVLIRWLFLPLGKKLQWHINLVVMCTPVVPQSRQCLVNTILVTFIASFWCLWCSKELITRLWILWVSICNFHSTGLVSWRDGGPKHVPGHKCNQGHQILNDGVGSLLLQISYSHSVCSQFVSCDEQPPLWRWRWRIGKWFHTATKVAPPLVFRIFLCVLFRSVATNNPWYEGDDEENNGDAVDRRKRRCRVTHPQRLHPVWIPHVGWLSLFHRNAKRRKTSIRGV